MRELIGGVSSPRIATCPCLLEMEAFCRHPRACLFMLLLALWGLCSGAGNEATVISAGTPARNGSEVILTCNYASVGGSNVTYAWQMRIEGDAPSSASGSMSGSGASGTISGNGASGSMSGSGALSGSGFISGSGSYSGIVPGSGSTSSGLQPGSGTYYSGSGLQPGSGTYYSGSGLQPGSGSSNDLSSGSGALFPGSGIYYSGSGPPSGSGPYTSGSGVISGDGGGDMPAYHYIEVSTGQNLSFSPILFGDEGVYRCYAQLQDQEPMFSDPYTLYISPEGSVNVSIAPSESLYDMGDNISLTCSALGGPDNTFQWQLNDVDLNGGNDTVVDRYGITADADGGVYMCVVVNAAGNDSDSTTVNVRPAITQQPVNVTAEVGSFYTLECRATGFPTPTYEWFKVGGNISENVIGEDTSNLTFNPVNYGDEGDYYCQVTSGDIILISDTATLGVSPRGTVAISPVNESFAVGEDAVLTCTAMGGPRNMFQWYRGGARLENNSVLTINNISLEDGGEYTCGVRNIGQEYYASTFVFISPRITRQPSDVGVTNGTMVILECRAEAFPDPSYEWTFSNGSNITTADSVLIPTSVVGIDTDTLSFQPAEFGSEGGYICTATSNGVTATSNVAVLSISPEGAVVISSSNTTVSTGDNTTLTCSALGGPNNTFAWLHEGMEINVTTATLTISSITVDEGGDYMCIVTNAAGSGSTIATIFIEPIITRVDDILTRNGSSVEFVCEADGIPSPEVMWQRLENGSYTTVSESRTYNITPVVFGDEGNYLCVATSDAGTASQIATLTISPEGSVEATPSDLSSERGVSQTFTCSSRGGPGNTFTWTRLLDRVVFTTNSTLRVLVDSAEAGGYYRCTVQNDAGNETDDVVLRVAVAVDTHPQTGNVSISEYFSLSCAASAFPLPGITWLHNSTEVMEGDDDRVNISQTTTLRSVTSTITTVNATSSDSGRYVCEFGAPPGTNFNMTNSAPALILVQATPERPRNVEGVNITSRNLTLQWVEPHDSNAPILGYMVMYREPVFQGGSAVDLNTTSTMVDVTGLLPGITYDFTVVAYNEIGNSPPSDVAPVRTLDEVPIGYPQNVAALTNSSTTIEVQWDPVPISERNGDIIDYEIELNQTTFPDLPLYGPRYTNGTQLSLVLTGLEEFVEYTVRVRAYTSAGFGPFSPPVSNETFPDRPAQPPQNVSATALSSTEIEVSWEQVPAIDQNGEITLYEVQYEPLMRFEGQILINSTNTTRLNITLTGLEEYVEYNITVRAYTSEGPGPYSDPPVTERTLEDEPSESPQNVSATALSSTEIEVSWEEVPTIDQNGVIITYEVQYEPLDAFGGLITTNATNTTILNITLTGLEEYVEYDITVRAYTSEGPGPYSDPPVTERTLTDVPGSPPSEVMAVNLSSTMIRVNWSEVPAIDQNGIITAYEVEYTQMMFMGVAMYNTTTVDSDTFSTVLTDLLEYVQYSIRVRAYTATGNGSYSDPAFVTTNEDVPAEPPMFVIAISPASTMIQVSWEQVPAIDENGVIIEYEVEYTQTTFDSIPTTQNITVNTTMATLTDLQEYVEYFIRVSASTIVGSGPYSDPINQTTLEDVPRSSPTNVSTEAISSKSIQVSWSEVPAIDENGVIIEYEVEYTQTTFDSIPTTQNITVNTTMATLTGLQEYVEYFIRVSASTIVGSGPYSDPINQTTLEDVPRSSPTNVSTEAISSKSIQVSWSEVAAIDQNGVIVEYVVEYTQTMFPSIPTTQSKRVSTTTVTLIDLQEYVEYSIRVRASTMIGPGPYSQPVNQRTLEDAPASPPSNISAVIVSSTSIKVNWSGVPAIDQNGVILEYEVEYTQITFDANMSQSVVVVPSMTQLLGLHEYVQYCIRVRAYTSEGPGPYSVAINITTAEDVPSAAPLELMVQNSSANSLSVSWQRPEQEDLNGILIRYDIEYFIAEEPNPQILSESVDTLTTMLMALNNYTIYNVSVYAVTIGRGPPANQQERTSENVPGEPPLNVDSFNTSSTSVRVVWTRPPPDRTYGILRRFEIRFFIPSRPEDSLEFITDIPAESISYEITSLLEFTNYSIEVSAVTIDNGPFSNPVYVVTDEDIPGPVPQPPAVNSDTITNTSAVISWDPPSDSNGVIISYTVQYGAVSMAAGGRRRRQIGELLPECIFGGEGNIDRMAVVPGTNTSLSLDQLTPFLTYEFSVQPETRVGRGEFSTPRSFQTAEHVPTAPRSLRVEYLSSSSLDVEWMAPQCDYGIRTSYMLEHMALPSMDPQGTVDTNVPTLNADETRVDLNGLSPNTNYSVTLRACTAVGCGSSTTVISPTNEDAPMPITNLVIESSRVTDSDNEVKLDITWTPPSIRNGPFHTRFIYSGSQTPDYPRQRSNSTESVTEILTGDVDSYVIERGLPYAEYTVRVTAINTKTGNRAPTVTEIKRTIAIEPTVVLGLTAEGLTSTSVNVSWDLPKYPNAPITGYTVYYNKISDSTLAIEQDPSAYMQDPNDINIDGYSLKNNVLTSNTVLDDDLEVYRYYSIIVSAVGKADSGAKLEGALVEVVARTFSDLPPEEPPVIEPGGESRNTITITLPNHTYIDDGEVILYAVIVIEGTSPNMRQSDYDDAKPYTPDATYYITAAWSKENVTRVPERYIVGNESVTFADGDTYLNAKLKSGSDYTFFAWIDLKSDLPGETLRIRTNFTTAETDAIPSNVTGPAVGGAFGAVLAIIACVMLLLVILFFLRRSRSKKVDVSGEVALSDLASSVEPVTAISSQVIANPLAAPHKGTFSPIPVNEFPAHVKYLHANDGFLFSEEYASVEPDHAPTSYVCMQPENQTKNRYANIKAYDHSRVHLDSSETGCDYINANHIHGYGQQNAFIATQGPVPGAIPEFWQMVWEQGTATIVMLTNLEEKGRIKCHKYWPDEMERTKKFDSIHVYFQEALVLAEYTIRTLSLQMDDFKEERIVKQFHYTVWPDHGVPDYPSPLLQFVRKVAASNPMNAGPIVVHCSAGVGRTGTFITLDAQLKRIKKEKNIDIFGFVRAMRSKRCYMVQTEPQYIFLHDALLEAIECGVTEVAARDLQSQYHRLSEVESATGRTGLQRRFMKLESTLHHRQQRTFSLLHVNIHKNRYTNKEMLPYDKNRCRLKSVPGEQGSDYINASFIDGYHRAKEFIATQGPLPDTEDDFWRMVWEKKSSTIIMLTKEKETDGKVKCHTYWPKSGAGQYEHLQVILHKTTNYPDYILREFNVIDTRDDSSLPVKHFQYTDWPEQSIPGFGSGIIDLIGQVQKWQRSSGDRPIIVHCSGGCGRTGTYIAVSILIERLKTEGVVDVFQTVRKLRLQRPGMVASVEQYSFCYKTLLEFLDSFELYANFK